MEGLLMLKMIRETAATELTTHIVVFNLSRSLSLSPLIKQMTAEAWISSAMAAPEKIASHLSIQS